VDQHAAAEKVIYERLFANIKNTKPAVQMLLVPFSWEVSLSVANLVKGRIDVMQSMGFLIEPFGGNAFLVKGYPQALGQKFDLHSLLDGISDVLAEPAQFQHRRAAATACKSAVKSGDPLDLKECQHLLNELVQLEAPLTCPHGRPTMINLPSDDLARRFRRP
jgi:DNA mismatch repair protein MutL